MLRTCRLAHLSVSVSVSLSFSLSLCACVCVGWSVCLSVRKVYSGKTAEWIQMPFGMVSAVGQRMGVLDGVVIIKGKGQFRG